MLHVLLNYLSEEISTDAISFSFRGLVPLHNACSYGHFEVTEMLLKAGANVNAMDLWQFTPLHEAASKSRIEVCSLLLSHGADPTLVNCHSKSALDAAPTRELQERLQCKNLRLNNEHYDFPKFSVKSYRQTMRPKIFLICFCIKNFQ